MSDSQARYLVGVDVGGTHCFSEAYEVLAPTGKGKRGLGPLTRSATVGGNIYVAQARGPDGPDKPKRERVSRHGVISAEQVHKRAALIIVRINAGEDRQ